MSGREVGRRPSFRERVRNVPGLMPYRSSSDPVGHGSLREWTNGELDRVNRPPLASRNLAQSGIAKPVYIINQDDLNNISPTGGRAVMQKVISADVVLLPKCMLHPHHSGVSTFGSQERPLGCKTILARGFPNNVSQAIVKEVFQLCGAIDSLLVHEGSSWHVRYSEEVTAENAIVFNGCRVQIDNENGPPNSCVLEVTYVRTKLDQCEHQERMFEKDVSVSLGNELYSRPSRVYSHYEAVSIVENFKNGNSVSESLLVICSWLNDGKLIDRSAYQFYAMLQSLKCYLRNLLNEKLKRRRNESVEDNTRVQVRIREVLMRSNLIMFLFMQVCNSGKNFFSRRQMENLTLWKMEITNILNNFIRQRNFNQCNSLIRSGRSNPVVNASNSDSEVDDATRVNNMLKHVSDLISQAQTDQNIYESHLLTHDSDARSIREHQKMQDLIWCVQEFHGRVSVFLRSAYDSQSET